MPIAVSTPEPRAHTRGASAVTSPRTMSVAQATIRSRVAHSLGLRAVDQEDERQQREGGQDRSRGARETGQVDGDCGEEGGGDERPAPELGPPRGRCGRLEGAVPAELEEDQPARRSQGGRAECSEGQRAPHPQGVGADHRDRHGAGESRLGGEPGVGRGEHQSAGQGGQLGAEELTHGLATGPQPHTGPQGQQGNAQERAGAAPVQGVQPQQARGLGAEEVDGEHAGHHQPERLRGTPQVLAGQGHRHGRQDTRDAEQHQACVR